MSTGNDGQLWEEKNKKSKKEREKKGACGQRKDWRLLRELTRGDWRFSRSPEMLAVARSSFRFLESRDESGVVCMYLSLPFGPRLPVPVPSLATSSLLVWFLCRHSPTCTISASSGPHVSRYYMRYLIGYSHYLLYYMYSGENHVFQV